MTPTARLVLVVNQLEEVFTLCADEQERRGFIQALCAAAGLNATRPGDPRSSEGLVDPRDAPALVVIGVRADFYARCAAYPELRPYLQDHQLVGAMDERGVRRAITGPAEAASLVVDRDLVEVMLADLGLCREHPHAASPASSPSTSTASAPSTSQNGLATSPNGLAAAGAPTGVGGTAYEAGRLPLLAHALRRTWEQREGRRLTSAAYRRPAASTGLWPRRRTRSSTAWTPAAGTLLDGCSCAWSLPAKAPPTPVGGRP